MNRLWQTLNHDIPPLQTYPGGIVASLRSDQFLEIANCVVGTALDSD